MGRHRRRQRQRGRILQSLSPNSGAQGGDGRFGVPAVSSCPRVPVSLSPSAARRGRAERGRAELSLQHHRPCAAASPSRRSRPAQPRDRDRDRDRAPCKVPSPETAPGEPAPHPRPPQACGTRASCNKQFRFSGTKVCLGERWLKAARRQNSIAKISQNICLS